MGISNWIYAWTVLFPITVLLYYFFRKRYEEITISSTLFWEESMRETKVSPYLKNLQRNILFYLQMAALLLFVFLLLGPFIKKGEEVSGQVIWIVDTSATMLVVQGEKSLFEQNREAMKQMAANREGQPVTIITTGKEPSIMIRDETDAHRIESAIDSLVVTYEHEFMDTAIELARSIAVEGTDIHIYTNSLDRGEIPEGDGSLSWVVNESKGPIVNVSLEKLGVLPTADGMGVIVKIVNQSEKDAQGDLQIIDVITEKILVEESFEVKAGQSLLQSFMQLPTSRAIQAEIIVKDDYEADNTAYFLLGNEVSEIVVDDQLHELVKKGFEAVGLPVTTSSGNEWLAAHEHSIIVTNDVEMLEMGSEPIILIGRNDLTAHPENGELTSLNDPLFSIADMVDVFVSEVYPPFEDFTTIATVGDQPFIQKSGRGDIVILSDIEMTDWPLHPSFPLFIWSAVETIRAEADTIGLFVPNERKAIIANEIEVYSDRDEYVTTFAKGADFIAPTQPGIYRVLEAETEKLFLVQLEEIEKEIAEGSSFKISRTESLAGSEIGKNRIDTLVLLPLLMLLLIEWEVQRRRGYPN